MVDTGAMISIMLKCCKRYPDHIKAMHKSCNGNYCPIPVVGAIGDDSVLLIMSTYLPVVVVLSTPYFNTITHEPIVLIFTRAKDLSICSILGMSALISIGPAIIDFAVNVVYTSAWPCGSLPIILHMLTLAPLLPPAASV